MPDPEWGAGSAGAPSHQCWLQVNSRSRFEYCDFRLLRIHWCHIGEHFPRHPWHPAQLTHRTFPTTKWRG